MTLLGDTVPRKEAAVQAFRFSTEAIGSLMTQQLGC